MTLKMVWLVVACQYVSQAISPMSARYKSGRRIIMPATMRIQSR
jgi:hypothetical protein